MGNITYSDWMENTLRDAEDYHKLASACWKALGVTAYTGKHIAEHITEMQAELTRLREENRELVALLRSYHDIAVDVDGMASRQEAHTKKMSELARLAKTDQVEAQRQMRILDSAPRVWDYGKTVTALRSLLKKSNKALAKHKGGA